MGIFLSTTSNHNLVIELVRIFIAHSGKDEWLITPIASNLESINVDPYLARLEDPTPYPLPKKLDDAIRSSVAMFVFLTPNVENSKDTWDVVNWEISAAYTYKKPIYVFAEKGVNVPFMVNYITVYARYDPLSQQSLNEMVDKVQGLANTFREAEDKANAAFAIIASIFGLGLLLLVLSQD